MSHVLRDRINRTGQQPNLGSHTAKGANPRSCNPRRPRSLRSPNRSPPPVRLGGFDDGLGVAVQKKLAGLVGDKYKKPKWNGRDVFLEKGSDFNIKILVKLQMFFWGGWWWMLNPACYTIPVPASQGRKFQGRKNLCAKEKICLQNARRATNQCEAQTKFLRAPAQPSDVWQLNFLWLYTFYL